MRNTAVRLPVRFAAVFVLGLAALTAACGNGASADPPAQTPPPSPTATPDDPTEGFERPPDGVAESPGDSVPLALGTFCWTQLCADAIGIITVDDALTAHAGETITITGDLANADFTGIAVSLWPLPVEPVDEGTWGQAWQPDTDGVSPDVELNTPSFVLPDDLEPGQYLVALYVSFAPVGDGSYGVIIEIQ